jgi:hypothetical protein
MDPLNTKGSAIVSALEVAYEAVRKNHNDLKPVLFIVGTGFDGRRKKWGHFRPKYWELPAPSELSLVLNGDEQFTAEPRNETPLDEIFVSGEGLSQGAEHTFTTIVHEAAHVVAAARGIKEVTGTGAYHNRRFLALAQELGMRYPFERPDRRIGFSAVVLTDEALKLYSPVISALSDALHAHLPLNRPRKAAKKAQGLLKAVCPCNRTIRLSKRSFDKGPAICGVCEEPFAVAA